MPHIDPEELSLLALYGAWLDEEGLRHLNSCDACSAEYAALRRAVDAMKTTPDSTSFEVPGPNVWSGIHRELGLSDATRAAVLERSVSWLTACSALLRAA